MFKLSTSDRLSRWKSFRLELDNLSIEDALQSTQDFWHGCPYIPFYLDVDNPASWPDPWELIIENYYCDLAKTLGMLYTVYLTSHGPKLNPEIRVYYDFSSRYTYHIAWLCQGKYVLNLAEDKVLNKEQINQKLKLKCCYTAADLKLEQY